MTRKLVWVSVYPAHYSRSLHRALEEVWPETFAFVYVRRKSGSTLRDYEVGELPQASVVIEGLSQWRTIRDMRHVLRSLNPKALIVNGHSPPSLAYAAIWGKINGRKVAYRSDTNLLDLFFHGSFGRRTFHRFLGCTLFRTVDLLLYIGSMNRWYYHWATRRGRQGQAFAQLVLPHDLVMLNRASEGSSKESRKYGSAGPVTFLYFGRLSPEKSVGALVRAAGLLKREDGSWRLIIAGDGDAREGLQRLVDEEGVGDHVRFIGAVRSSERSAVYELADVLVLPSAREPWGLVINEALGAQLAVVAPYWVGAVSDLVLDGYNGVVLKSNTPEALAVGMSSFLSRPERAAAMGRRGPQILSSGGWNLNGALEQTARAVELLIPSFVHNARV